CQHFWGSPYTF
nr:immunoglobulin light chain junction region [Mus musculus]NSL98947.1 immunoglobulin light chain junction region [Mus musculus]NSM02660.1 immunoglobulin light chain junction region [Mus musculus]